MNGDINVPHKAKASKLVEHEEMDKFKAPTFKENSLVLYFHPYNFYSQKIMLLLYEKNVEFIPYAIDLSNGEQYSAWFLHLNPNGSVPVLQDGAIIIPNSSHIINYLEAKFREKINAKLQPLDVSSKEFIKMQSYEQVLTRLPVGALSLGSFVHDDLKLTPKPPFIGPIRKSCLNNNEKVYELLKRSAEVAQDNKNELLLKIDFQERRKRLVYSRVEFQKILDAVGNALIFFENELKANQGQEWLVYSEFTLADISFGLLLNRLYQLGFENYYWTYGKLPLVESYFLRFKKRDSYQKLVPNNFEILRDIWQKTPANYKIGAGVLGMAMFAALAHK